VGSTAAVLATLLLGQFMGVLDGSIANVAAPTMGVDLHASGAELQLIVAGYLISYAVLLITGARLGDRVGHGRMFRIGVAAFTAMSLACGLAPNGPTLIVFRVLQGAGAALLAPQVMSLIQHTFSGGHRARALSLYAAVNSCGIVVGQVLGGVLVTADLFGSGWRPVFLVNVPIGLALLWLSARRLPPGSGDPDRRMDLPGVLALSVSVAALVIPLVLGHELGWPAWSRILLAGSVIAFAGFVLVERAVAKSGGAPLVSGRVLRSPGLALAATSMLIGLAVYAGYLFSMALHLQAGLGFSAVRTGLTFAPAAIGFGAVGLLWRRLPARWHVAIIPVGLTIAAAAYAALVPLLADGRTGWWLELDLLVMGSAMGLAFSPLFTVALARVELADAAQASGVMTTVMQLGQVVGVATIGTLFLIQVHGTGAAASSQAIGAAASVLAGGTLAAAAVSTLLMRRRG
jgi:EmrB/QacA subfamily drug resistance transporter